MSSLGNSSERFAEGLLAGETGIRPITQFDVSACRATHAGRLVDFDATAYLPPMKLRRLDAVARLALACTRDALDDARIARGPEGHDDVGVVLGSVSAGVHATGEYLESYGLTPERLKLATPHAVVMHPGPMNRGVEIDSAVADSDRSLITRQVGMGIPTRMACLELLSTTAA